MENVFLWGTGQIAEYVMKQCQTLINYNILGFIDNSEKKIGSSFFGKKIYSPDILEKMEPDKIVILTDSFDVIRQQIEDQYPQWCNKIENKNYFYQQSIIKRYKNTDDFEIKAVLGYIVEHGLQTFNYPFVKKYETLNIPILWDDEREYFYVMHLGHRLYMSRKFKTTTEVQNYYKSILIEQDSESPHRYLTDGYEVKKGDIVIDVGAAEGNFSLEVVEKAAHIYIVEADESWIEPLKLTFQDYGNKVSIIHRFVSSYDEEPYARLDSIIKGSVNFIKMDIEGYEWDALEGTRGIIRNSNQLQLAICSYHSDFDKDLIELFMKENNIKYESSRGYMWFPDTIRQNYVSTSLNRAIVRGYKNTGM